MTSDTRIHLAQINPTVGALDTNTDKILRFWQDNKDCDLIAFPELCVCGYPPEDLILKPAFLDACDAALLELCTKSKDFQNAAIIGAPYRKNGKLFNAVHVIQNGEIMATRLKHNLPDYGVFDETRIFSAGPLPDPVSLKGAKLGIMICEDMWYPDVSRHLKQKSADILISINASPFDILNVQNRITNAQNRVKETGLPLAYINQVGGQDELVFDGASFFMDTNGEISTHAQAFQESILLPEDTGHTNSYYEKAEYAPFKWSETQTETVYTALTTGLHDYVKKNGFQGVLLGLSGGIDSALAAVIAVDALGFDNVKAYMLPSQYTSRESLEDAAELAENLGISLETISIQSTINTLREELERVISDNPPPITYENMQSRARGLILMTLSNASGRMLITTGNKSEMATGYATIYGDMCGGFNVLKDVYKTQVYHIARWYNTRSNTIPSRIITKIPTAELKPNQSDQDTLPPYDVLDDILHDLIENDALTNKINNRKYPFDLILKINNMLFRSEYKRVQSAPGTKITPRAFGRDRRYPITNGFSFQSE